MLHIPLFLRLLTQDDALSQPARLLSGTTLLGKWVSHCRTLEDVKKAM